MLFDAGNPYRTPAPPTLQLGWEDFTCGLSAANEAALDRPAAWSVLAYMAADCDLAPYIFDNLVDLKAAGSTASVHVLALFDGPLLMDSVFARLNAGSSLDADVLLRFGELRTSDTATLSLAVRLAKAYPAERRLVVLGGHGDGWRRLLLDQDLGTRLKREGRLVLPGPAAACDTRLQACQAAVMGRLNQTASMSAATGPIDVLALDVCLGGNIETLVTLGELAEWLVVSQDTMPGEGLAYAAMLDAIAQAPGQSAETLVEAFVGATGVFYKDRAYAGPLRLAALRTDALPELCAAFVALVRAIDLDDAQAYAAVRAALQGAWSFGLTDAIDLRGFVLLLLAHGIPPEAAAAAQAVLDAWPRLVRRFTGPGGPAEPNGISIYAPPPQAFDPGYIEVCNGLKHDMGIWAWFLGKLYVRWLGQDAPSHPLIAAITRTVQAADAGPAGPG